MKLILLAFLVALPAMAQNWMVDTDTVLSNSQTAGVKSYGKKKRCRNENPGKTCVEVSGRNLRYERHVAGAWVIDDASKTAYDTEVSAKATKRADRIARRAEMKAAKAAINAATTVQDLKPILRDILKELNELNGTE